MANETKSNTADYRHIAKSDANEAKFPAQISGEYRVHISETAYERMKKHVANTTDVELCGVLIGDVHRDSMGFFLKIIGVIEGENSNNYGAQVTFTHQTWDHINAVKDREFPKARIVGWYHTHPGFGIFLSGMDTFIQENFFNLPYQVAIVIETKAHEEGCFAWVDGKSTPLHRYWVGDKEVTLSTGASMEFKPDSTQAPDGVDKYPMQASYAPGAAAAAGAAPYPEPAPAGFSVMTMFTMILMLLCGLMMGKYYAEAELRVSAIQNLESELYSELDFATLNAGAAQDFTDVKEKLAAVDKKLQSGDAAAAKKEVQELNTDLEKLQKVYTKKRSEFRNDLATLSTRKQNLSERVDLSSRHQDEMDRNVAMLYIIRVQDMVRASGAPDGSKLSPGERELGRKLLDKAISIAPELKGNFELANPKLMQSLYSQDGPADAPKSDPPKPESPAKP